MRLGCCGTLNDAAVIRDAGFDFVEVNIQAVLKGTEDDATWSKSAPDVDKFVLPVEAANCLVPGNIPIVGPQRDMGVLTKYLKNVAVRAKRLGMKVLVFGSGGARRRPEDVTPAQAMAQLTEFTRMAAETCWDQGVLLVIEHLNKAESNTINSLAEEKELMERVGHPGCAALVDTYHWGLENDTEEAVVALGNQIRHVHVAEVKDRLQPGGHGRFGAEGTPKDAFDFEAFFCLLHKLGYDERVCIEARWSKPLAEGAADSAALLRAAWQSASRCAV